MTDEKPITPLDPLDPKAVDPTATPDPPQGFTEEQTKQIKDIVVTAVGDSQKPPEVEPSGGGGDYFAPGPEQPGIQPAGAEYNPYVDPQPTVDPKDQRMNEFENTLLGNHTDISYMKFKSDLDDKINEDATLRPFRAEALKKHSEYLKSGQVIAADTMLDLMTGAADRKKRAEERALQVPGPGGDLQPTGGTKRKHPSEMTIEEMDKEFGNIPI